MRHFAEWKSQHTGVMVYSVHLAFMLFALTDLTCGPSGQLVGLHFTDEDTLLDCLLNVTLWLRQARSCCSRAMFFCKFPSSCSGTAGRESEDETK